MKQRIETIVIGGGQAGLATSYFLTHHGREHIVLEKSAAAGNAWRNDRWDSFTLVTPNWAFKLPGAEYLGNEPDEFMKREEIITAFEKCIDRFHLPMQYNSEVLSVAEDGSSPHYFIRTTVGDWESDNIVVATGLFQQPKAPALRKDLPGNIDQLYSGQYRNPNQLQPGSVLVVGSAQSGCQIAEELYQNGRKVYLCVGGAGRAPRRYRGKDIFEWLHLSGFLDKTVDQLPSPKAKFASSVQASGRNRGHTLNLHQFARDGVVLLGRLQGATTEKIWLSPDLKINLANIDKFEVEFINMVDRFIEQNEIPAPQERLPELRDGYEIEEISELSLTSSGITTIIWAMGYRFDYSMVKFPVVDEDGYPVQQRGVTRYPGLFFLGMPWLYKQKSGLLAGVGEDAEYVAARINELAHA